MLTPLMGYFIAVAVYAAGLAKWPEQVLGHDAKDAVQALLDEWHVRYGREIAGLLTGVGFCLIALLWPVWVIGRLKQLIFPRR